MYFTCRHCGEDFKPSRQEIELCEQGVHRKNIL